MAAHFLSPDQRRLFDAVVSSLNRLGYVGELLALDYQYLDWFSSGTPRRAIQAACFGRLPAAYDTALLGVAAGNGQRGSTLINAHRSLGSPTILEIENDRVGVWSIGAHEDATERVFHLTLEEFVNWTNIHAEELSPSEYLRTKNINKGQTIFFQGSLFAGLIPELEERIADILEPRLTAAFKAGLSAYEHDKGKSPPEETLFKLAFWILTGKVFADRGHPDFVSLATTSDPDVVLTRVAEHYKEKNVVLLNRSTRQAVFDRIWSTMDFRNLSVEVLAQIWSRTLVSPATRDRLGIHRTPRSIVKYITDRIPFEDFPADKRRVVEPCSGSSAFLIGALDRLRDLLPGHQSQRQRHSYFKKMLRGFERDPFGREIGRLCLALADYPEANGWDVQLGNVFQLPSFSHALSQSRIVLCNPPFGDLTVNARTTYGIHTSYQPAALLERVLESLHPEGVVGFVFPRTFVDGFGYTDVRRKLAARYDSIEVVSLPDKAFEDADQETALVIATRPHASGRTRVIYSVVREHQWEEFDNQQKTGASDSVDKTPDEAAKSLAVPELRDVWEYLSWCGTIADVTGQIARGVRWQSGVALDERESIKWKQGWHKGIPRLSTHLKSFQAPPTIYLDFRPGSREFKAFERPWEKPKVLMNKAAKGRSPWRLAAFADAMEGLAAAQNYLALWPKNRDDLLLITAVLNGPVANAFVTVTEGKTDITIETIQRIPFPVFSSVQKTAITRLIPEYLQAVEVSSWSVADQKLRMIDATVLNAYGLPPKLERKLLDYFRGATRLVPFEFADYFPESLTAYFSLSDWLDGRISKMTAGGFRSKTRDLPSHILDAMARSNEPNG